MPQSMAINDLARLLTQYPRTIRGKAVGSDEFIAEAVKIGVLVPAGTVERVLCDHCDEQHLADIVTTDEGQGWYCPADGFVNADPPRIAAYRVSVEAFVDALAGCVDRQRRWAKPRGAPVIWSIGHAAISGLQIAVYFALDAGVPAVLNQLRSIVGDEPRVDCIAVLTNDSRELRQLTLPRVGSVVRLSDCVELSSAGQIVLNREWLGRIVIRDELLPRIRPGRSNDKEQMALNLIREMDANREIRRLKSARERQRVLERAAKLRHGKSTTLSRKPCDRAWAEYIREISR